jgi:uncharacterized iron-regulated membrane protein
MTQTIDPAQATAQPARRVPKRRTRRPVRRFMIVSHRWLSLVLGVVLLVISTSGAILVFRPELQRAINHDAYDVSGTAARINLVDARAIVLNAHPTFDATSVWAEHGVFRVTDYTTSWTVDPGTGRILGHVGKAPTWLGFLDNLHECFLSCDDSPGTVHVLTKEIPGTSWLGLEGEKVTWGGLVLGLSGLLLLYLSFTGIWLWFPRPGRWRSSMTIRWRRGRFARDTDLHQVGGMIAIPFLLLWAVTGAGYELGVVEKAWYAATPGHERPAGDAVSAKSKAPDISAQDAVDSATRLHPEARLINIDVPAKDDPTSAYTMYFQDGYDPYGHSEYPGDLGVYVDRHTGVAKDYYGLADESVSQHLWESFNYPAHSGYIVNGWWRIIWFVFGLSPLLLAVTGISTWLVRRTTRRARGRSRRQGTTPPPVPAGLAQELSDDPETDPRLADGVS